MRKTPEVTLMFWVMKICATTLGKTAGDLLSMTMHAGYAVSSLILIGFFFATLVTQLVAKRYHAPLYWAVILSTSTAGTTMSDFMDRTLGLGYAKGSLILVAILGVILAVWRTTEKSLAVDQVTTRRAELFYWSAISSSRTRSARRSVTSWRTAPASGSRAARCSSAGCSGWSSSPSF